MMMMMIIIIIIIGKLVVDFLFVSIEFFAKYYS